MIPARHLIHHGVTSRFSAGVSDVLEPDPPDCVVFVKAFGAHDVEQACRAARTGVPVLLDVCDNVFASAYRGHSAANLRRMAEVASAIITTGPTLANVLHAELGARSPLHVIPDPVEQPADVRYAARALWRERTVRALRYQRSDLPPAIAGGLLREFASLRRRRAKHVYTTAIPQVLWFGNVGSLEPRFGIININDIAAELEVAAQETPFRLLVVTSDRAVYRRRIGPLPLDTAFAPWERTAIFHHIRRSAVVIVPNSRDDFSICKSANRPLLALSQGVPVVATRTPSLDPFESCILFDDFRAGIVTYLRDRALAAEHIKRASVILRSFMPETVAATWFRILRSACHT